MRILLAEGDGDCGSATHAALCQGGYAMDWVRTGRQMYDAVLTRKYACGVVGVPMRDLSVDSLLQFLRGNQALPPVIVLAAQDAPIERAALIDRGAADCLVRPFNVDELAACIRRLLERTHRAKQKSDPLTLGCLRLDVDNLCAILAGRRVPLTCCEFSILATLMRHREQICSHALLEDLLPSRAEAVSAIALTVHIHFLRIKLAPGVILTERGRGYRLGSETLQEDLGTTHCAGNDVDL